MARRQRLTEKKPKKRQRLVMVRQTFATFKASKFDEVTGVLEVVCATGRKWRLRASDKGGFEIQLISTPDDNVAFIPEGNQRGHFIGTRI